MSLTNLVALLQDAPAPNGAGTVRLICLVLLIILVAIIFLRRKGKKKKEEEEF